MTSDIRERLFDLGYVMNARWEGHHVGKTHREDVETVTDAVTEIDRLRARLDELKTERKPETPQGDPQVVEESDGCPIEGSRLRREWRQMKRRLDELEGQEPVVPEGYALVPVEPTKEMLEAARIARDEDREDFRRVAVPGDNWTGLDHACVYKTMLAAAPPAGRSEGAVKAEGLVEMNGELSSMINDNESPEHDYGLRSARTAISFRINQLRDEADRLRGEES